MGPLLCFVFCLVGDCGKIVIFAILAKLAVFANFYGAPSLLCALPLTIEAKLSFSPYLPNSPLSPIFMGPLHCFVLCLVGDCGKIVIFAIFAKFAAFANFYGASSLLCALPRWRLWQNCHFRHICQIRRFRQLLWGPFTACHFYGAPYCFVLCLVVDLQYLPNSPLSPLPYTALCFASLSNFAILPNSPPTFMGSLFPRWRFLRRFRQLLWGPFTALCFASLAIVAKLSFSPYLPNSPLSPTFMGPLHCFVLCLVGDCGKIVIFAIFAKFAAFANFYGAPSLLCALPRWRLWQNCHFRHICQIRRFRQLLWGPSLLCALPRWRLWQNCHFRHICQIRRFRQLLWGPYHCFVLCLVGDCGKIVIFAIFAKFAAFANFYGAPISALCFASLAIVAKLSFSPYLPNSPLSPTFMGPLHCFVLCLVGDCGKIVIFAIFAKFAALANFYGAPSLLCALPRWRLWQNCHFRNISQIRRFRQLLWGPFTALCFASLTIVAKLSFSPYLPNSPLSPTFMGPLHCFVLCLVGDCGKIVIFAIFAKFAAFANFYGALHCFVLCLVGDCGKIVIFAIFAKFAAFANFYGALHCFVLCLVGDCGKIVIFAILAKFAAFANFYGAPSLLCALPRWRLWQNCHFRHICQIRRFLQFLWEPFTALCFASLAIVAKLSFSPYLPNSPLSPTFMGPLDFFVLCLVCNCGKIVIFAIFAKFAAFANFYGAPSLLCVLPRWRLWQNCHFRHISQTRRFRQLLWGPFTALCFASLTIVAKLSFSPYLPNSPLSPIFMGTLHCFVLCLVGDCGKIVIFAIFAKFAAFANFYGAPILLCALPRWRLWENCHFRHICQIRRFRQLLWGLLTFLCFASFAIVAKL